jgi:hypothetical protein
MAVGIPLGILVGFLSSAAFIIFLRTAFLGDALKAGSSLLAMPTSWFTGGWITRTFELELILSSYVTSLAVTLVVICAYPLFRVVVRVGNELGSLP